MFIQKLLYSYLNLDSGRVVSTCERLPVAAARHLQVEGHGKGIHCLIKQHLLHPALGPLPEDRKHQAVTHLLGQLAT